MKVVIHFVSGEKLTLYAEDTFNPQDFGEEEVQRVFKELQKGSQYLMFSGVFVNMANVNCISFEEDDGEGGEDNDG